MESPETGRAASLFTLYLFLVLACFSLLPAGALACFFWCTIAKARDSSNWWILLWNLKESHCVMLMLAYLRLTREIATLVPHSDPPVPWCWPSLEWPSPGKVYSVQFTTHCTGSVLTVAIFMVLCLQVVCSLEVKSSSSSSSSCLLGLELSSGLTLNTSSVQMIYSFPSYS